MYGVLWTLTYVYTCNDNTLSPSHVTLINPCMYWCGGLQANLSANDPDRDFVRKELSVSWFGGSR